jgi:hypothetical protein
MHYNALATVIGVVALSVGAGSATASGDSHGHWKKVRIEFAPNGDGGMDLPPIQTFCDPADPAEPPDPPSQCVSLRIVNVTQGGDLVGSTLQGGAIVLGAPGHLIQSVAGTFTGTVNGCGTGGFRYTGVEDFASPTSVLSYTIVEGSGFGELEGITGSFGTRLAETDEVFVLRGTEREITTERAARAADTSAASLSVAGEGLEALDGHVPRRGVLSSARPAFSSAEKRSAS